MVSQRIEALGAVLSGRCSLLVCRLKKEKYGTSGELSSCDSEGAQKIANEILRSLKFQTWRNQGKITDHLPKSLPAARLPLRGGYFSLRCRTRRTSLGRSLRRLGRVCCATSSSNCRLQSSRADGALAPGLEALQQHAPRLAEGEGFEACLPSVLPLPT